ncbi:MAG TPA: hypothetical protein VGE76_15685, partial [Opitutaceae bacterium]
MAENPIPEKETKEPLLPGPKPSEGGVALESKSIPNFETSFGETGKVAQAQQGDAISGNKIQNHGFSAAEVQQIVSSKDQQHAEETRHWREMVERLLRPGQSAKKRVAREGYRRPAAGASARADAKPPEILTIESAVAFIASEQPALGVDDFTVVLECILRAERGPPVSPTPPVPPAPPEPVVLALKKKSQAPPPAAPLPSILDQWRADRMRFMDSTGAILKRGANDRMVVGFESETRRDETLASLGTRVIWLGEEVPGRLLADGLLSHESSGVRAFTLERALEIAIADPGETGGRFVRRVGALLTESIGEKSECAGWYFGMLQAMWAAPVLQPHIVALLKSFVEGGKWQTVFSLAKACSKIAFATRAEPLFDLLEQTTMPEDSK